MIWFNSHHASHVLGRDPAENRYGVEPNDGDGLLQVGGWRCSTWLCPAMGPFPHIIICIYIYIFLYKYIYIYILIICTHTYIYILYIYIIIYIIIYICVCGRVNRANEIPNHGIPGLRFLEQTNAVHNPTK